MPTTKTWIVVRSPDNVTAITAYCGLVDHPDLPLFTPFESHTNAVQQDPLTFTLANLHT